MRLTIHENDKKIAQVTRFVRSDGRSGLIGRLWKDLRPIVTSWPFIGHNKIHEKLQSPYTKFKIDGHDCNLIELNTDLCRYELCKTSTYAER